MPTEAVKIIIVLNKGDKQKGAETPITEHIRKWRYPSIEHVLRKACTHCSALGTRGEEEQRTFGQIHGGELLRQKGRRLVSLPGQMPSLRGTGQNGGNESLALLIPEESFDLSQVSFIMRVGGGVKLK